MSWKLIMPIMGCLLLISPCIIGIYMFADEPERQTDHDGSNV